MTYEYKSYQHFCTKIFKKKRLWAVLRKTAGDKEKPWQVIKSVTNTENNTVASTNLLDTYNTPQQSAENIYSYFANMAKNVTKKSFANSKHKHSSTIIINAIRLPSH